MKSPELQRKSQLMISSVGIYFTAKRGTLTRVDEVAGPGWEGGGAAGPEREGGGAAGPRWEGGGAAGSGREGGGTAGLGRERGGAPWLGFTLFAFPSGLFGPGRARFVGAARCRDLVLEKFNALH